MNELIKFIAELKEIKDSIPQNNLTKSIVDDKISKYEKELEQMSIWEEEQSQLEPLMVTGYEKKEIN